MTAVVIIYFCRDTAQFATSLSESHATATYYVISDRTSAPKVVDNPISPISTLRMNVTTACVLNDGKPMSTLNICEFRKLIITHACYCLCFYHIPTWVLYNARCEAGFLFSATAPVVLC